MGMLVDGIGDRCEAMRTVSDFKLWLASEAVRTEQELLIASECMVANAGKPAFLTDLHLFERMRARHAEIRRAAELVNEWRASR